MRTARHPILQLPRMHSLCKLLKSKALLDRTSIRFASSSPPFSAKISGNLSFSHHFGSSGWGAVNHAGRCSDDEPGSSPEKGDAGDARKVWTFYDPLEGKLITRVAEEYGGLEGKGGEEDEGPKMEKPVKKFPVPRGRKVDVNSDEEDGKSVSSVSASQSSWLPATRKKSAKEKVLWVCENCGATPGQWWGTCRSCQAMNTIRQLSEWESKRATGFEASEAVTRSWLPQERGDAVPQSLVDVKKGMNQLEWRIPL